MTNIFKNSLNLQQEINSLPCAMSIVSLLFFRTQKEYDSVKCYVLIFGKPFILRKFHRLVVEIVGGGWGIERLFNAIILNLSIEHNFRHNAMFSGVILKSVICTQIFENWVYLTLIMTASSVSVPNDRRADSQTD